MRKCDTSNSSSRAKGVMFWWCGKDRWDGDVCRFARPVSQGNRRVCRFWRLGGACKKGAACEFLHDEAKAKEVCSVVKEEVSGSEEGTNDASRNYRPLKRSIFEIRRGCER